MNNDTNMQKPTESTYTTAEKKFTDREEPRKAFVDNYNNISKNLKDYKVLSYYGVGGIGKTSLINELCRWMDKTLDAPYHVVYDFEEEGVNKLSILYGIKKLLQKNYQNEFQFPLFDIALLRYSKLSTFDKIDDNAVKDIISKSPLLEIAVGAASLIPCVSEITQAIQLLDKGTALYKNHFRDKKFQKKYAQSIAEISYLQASELINRIHEYFIIDMYNNMVNFPKPLVIFFDTYEKFVNTFEDYDVLNDVWLRKGTHSVIKSIPGILWVIAGRDQLTWLDDNSDNWDKLHLETHLLGNLSDTDSDSYLTYAGITNQSLKDYIIKLTSGTPVFLDMCVNQYNDIIATTRIPKPEDFGTDLKELVRRYLRYMNDTMKEMAYFLACIGKWTDNEAIEIGYNLKTIRSFSERNYLQFIQHSFIVKDKECRYYMHDTVKKAICDKAGNKLCSEANIQLLQYRLNTLSKESSSVTYIYNVENIVSAFYNIQQFYPSMEDVFTQNFEQMILAIKGIEERGCYQDSLRIAQDVSAHCELFYANTIYEALSKKLLAEELLQSGNYSKAKATIEKSLLIIDTLLNDSKQFFKYKLSIMIIYSRCLTECCLYKKAQDVLESITCKIGNICKANEIDYILLYQSLANVYHCNGSYKNALDTNIQLLSLLINDKYGNNLQKIEILYSMVHNYYSLGEYNKGLEICEQVYTKRAELLGTEHPDTIRVLKSKAYGYERIGDYSKSQDIYDNVYAIAKALLGDTHPITLDALHGVFVAYVNTGNYSKVLEILEQPNNELILSDDASPFTLNILNDIGIAYSKKGEYQKAIDILKDTYEKFTKTLGSNHPDTVATLNNIASTLLGSGQYDKALSVQQTVCGTLKNQLGENHPNTLRSVCNLCSIYAKLGEYQEAIEMQKFTYALSNEVLGEYHPDTLLCLNNLASLFYETGQYEGALKLQQQIYEIRKTQLGEYHPDTLTSLNNLGNTLTKLGELHKAIDVLKDAYEHRKEILGEDHPDTLVSLNNVATAFMENKQFSEALEILQQVYGKLKTLLGENHPNTLVILSNIATAYMNNGMYKEALELQQDVYEKQKAVLGEDHPDTIYSLNNLAALFINDKQYSKALELQKLVYEKMKALLGENHPDTINAKNLHAALLMLLYVNNE